jgi:lysophospholipase L1-like esterase
MKYLKLIAINVLILALLLLILDKVLFVFRIGLNTPKEQRAIRLREHPPLVNIVGNDSLTIDFRTDNDGYILPHGGKSNGNHIVFVGGSTTECIEVNEYKRFPYLVGELLPNMNYKTINSGISGNTSQHSLNLILNKIAFQKPKIIVLMHDINDLNTYIFKTDYWNATGNISNLLSLIPDVDEKAKRLLPVIYPQLKKRLWTKKEVIVVNDITEETTSVFLKDFSRNLLLIKQICEAFDIQLILMTQARDFIELKDYFSNDKIKPYLTLRESFHLEFKHAFDQVNDVTRSFAKDNHIPLIDLASLLNDKPELFNDIVHYNDQGSEKAANIISEHLISFDLENKMLPKTK